MFLKMYFNSSQAFSKKKIFTYFQNPFGNLGIFFLEKEDSEWVLEKGDIYIIFFILRLLPFML